jgi:uroporphyrinogen decarboxylase
MTPRERVQAACHHQQPDRTPRCVIAEWHVIDRLKSELGSNDLGNLFRNDMRDLGPKPTVLKTDFSRYFTHPRASWDEWGRGRVWDEGGYYAEYLYPLQNATTVDEIESYPWPDLSSPYRYEGFAEYVSSCHEQGYPVLANTAETVFEIAWQLRSMDQLSEDLLSGSEIGVRLLDHIAELRYASARELARAGADIIGMGDDVAMQTGLMISRKMFKQCLQPRFMKTIAAAREANPDVLIWYHSDGKINDLIPDLIETGIDILNPVQPECVDHAWVKETYGDRLAFSGGLGVQSVLPFGTPAQVKEHVRAAIETLGKGGGYIVGPSHVIESDVPTANIVAMIEAMDEFC